MGFGLPSREYYLKNNSVKERDAYLKMMIKVAVLFGADQEYVVHEMKRVLKFESQLANVSTLNLCTHSVYENVHDRMQIFFLSNTSYKLR